MRRLIVFAVALVARAGVVLWAGSRFPAAADGIYYDQIARRIAQGLGSTWAWPDGAVTYAAHYPVGYPAILAVGYGLFGAYPAVAGWMNALLGAIAALLAYELARNAMSERLALVGGLLVALHPGLVLYTPAIMTEGVTAALLVVAVWLASRRRVLWLGIVLGVTTLVRPQMLVLAPLLGLLASGADASAKKRLGRAALACAVAVLVCVPWTARNCVRMHRCVLSFNGGWNLLIGAGETATGAWAPIDVPDECKTVWDEAEKDACFGRAARRIIAERPARFLALVPAKLAATFDYAGAPGFYLHAANPSAFGDRAKLVVGAVETLYERLAYGALLFAAALCPGPRRKARIVLGLASAPFLLLTHVYVAVLGIAVVLGLLGRTLLRLPLLFAATFFAIVTTAAVHAIFFGSGRYSMVVFPLVTALAPLAAAGRGRPSAGAGDVNL
jgi:hypothetical protein